MSFPSPCPKIWECLKIFAPRYHVGMRQAFNNYTESKGEHTPNLYAKKKDCKTWTEHEPVKTPRRKFNGSSIHDEIWFNEIENREIFIVSTDMHNASELIIRVESRDYDSDVYKFPVSYLTITPTDVCWNDVYHWNITMDIQTGLITEIEIGTVRDVGCAPIPDYMCVRWAKAPDLTCIVRRWRHILRSRKQMDVTTPCPKIWECLKIFAPRYHVGIRQAFNNYMASKGEHTPKLYSKKQDCQNWAEQEPVKSPRQRFEGSIRDWIDYCEAQRILVVSTHMHRHSEIIIRVESRYYDSVFSHPVSYLTITPTHVIWNDIYHWNITMDIQTGLITEIEIGTVADVGCAPIPAHMCVDWAPAPDLTCIVRRWRYILHMRKCREITQKEAYPYLDPDSLSIVIDFIAAPKAHPANPPKPHHP